MKIINSKTVIFIHGAFVSYRCWDEWKSYFETKGFSVTAPPWPYKDEPAEVLRSRHPDAKVASIRLNRIIDHYENIIKKLSEKPVLIGHSLGGLITQVLLQKDVAAAGVAIHSVPPKGIIPLEFSFYKASGKSLGFLTSTKKTYLISFKDWQYAFTNEMPLDVQRATYEKYAVPESKLAIRGGLTNAAKVDFKKPHVPLLITSGSIDNIMPASVNLTNYKKYMNGSSIVDYKEFDGRNHFVLGQPTWKEDADYILNWIGSN